MGKAVPLKWSFRGTAFWGCEHINNML